MGGRLSIFTPLFLEHSSSYAIAPDLHCSVRSFTVMIGQEGEVLLHCLIRLGDGVLCSAYETGIQSSCRGNILFWVEGPVRESLALLKDWEGKRKIRLVRHGGHCYA